MVSFHNFKSQNFKLSVSNPKSRYVAYVSVLSQISNCQGLGRKNKHDNLKTDRTEAGCPRRGCGGIGAGSGEYIILCSIVEYNISYHTIIYIYIYIYVCKYIERYRYYTI